MFIPIRADPKRLTAARSGEFGKGVPSRPCSASAGATSLVTRNLVTGLAVVSYILAALRPLVPGATAMLDWRLPCTGPSLLMLFEGLRGSLLTSARPGIPATSRTLI
jgi:hypothetical protein